MTKRILVYGGSGALGEYLINHLKNKNYWVLSIDLKENQKADVNILVNPADSVSDQSLSIEKSITSLVITDKLDAILNVAGGWTGGNASSALFIQNCELMWKQSVSSSIISALLASKFLKENGLLTLTGAAAALDSTPGMIGYGLAKSAVHHLTRSLSDPATSGLPSGTSVAAILPVTLDTPMNRKWMPNADFGKWTPMSFVVELMEKWIEGKERPESGKLIKLVTNDFKTETSSY